MIALAGDDETFADGVMLGRSKESVQYRRGGVCAGGVRTT